MVENITKAQRNEAVELIKLIQKLNKSEQLGVLMMIQGTQIITGATLSRPRFEPPAPTFGETP